MNYEKQHHYEMSLRNLNDQSITKMTTQEKVINLQYIENHNAELQGRIPGIIVVENLDKGTAAQQRGIEIVLDENYLNTSSYSDLVNTIYHEGSRSHMGAFQAEYLESVRNNLDMSQEELMAYNAYPESMNFEEYYNHPAEIQARAEADYNTDHFMTDQQIIHDYDSNNQEHFNQILVTHDENVLNVESDITIEQDANNLAQDNSLNIDNDNSI